MTMINEDLARRSKENMSFSSYKAGSATAEYNSIIAKVTELVEQAKERVSPEARVKLDRFLESYKTRYANWINARNSNGSKHVSVMIAGPSNYNMKAHERYLSRESKLWEEYEEFKNPEYKISSIVAGDKIIKSNDANAIEKLEVKLAKLEELQELMKSTNKVIKNKKWTDEVKIELLVERGISVERATSLLQPSHCCSCGFASYELTNNNATIRNTKQRIAHLKKLAEHENTEIVVETQSGESDGIRIVDNVEAHRLQIFFNGKPSAEVRTQLKKNGFRWTPSIGAWQSYRSENANRAAKEIVSGV
jgi:methionine synthase II (cobalamin-independent)